MTRNILFIFIETILFTASLSAQPLPTELKPGQTPEGVVYYLPKTALRFHLAIERETYTPGRFARYAEKYLQVKGVSTEPSVRHQLLTHDMECIGLRDTSKCYAVRLKGKAQTAEIRLSDEGTLLAVNDEPIVSPVLQLTTTLSHHSSSLPVSPLLPVEAMKAGSTAKQAELTAQQILDLQEHRQLLVTGEADETPQDARQLQRMLEEIDTKTTALMTMFTGYTQRDTTLNTVTFCPDSVVVRQVLFRLSSRLGLVDSDDLAGTPYYIMIAPIDSTQQGVPENKNKTGFYVNVPCMTKVTLAKEDELISAHDVPMAQFGFIELRDGDNFKKYVTHLQLHPATGAVVRQQVDIPQKK